MKKYYLIDPELYDKQFWWKTDDLEFWKNQLTSKKNKTILELAAGTGRIASALMRENILYSGLELSGKYVQYANDKLKNIYGKSDIIQGDMIDFKLNKYYDYIFIGFNSFLHILKETDALKCLKSIKKHMKASSTLYIDLFVPHPLFLYRPNNAQLNILNFQDIKTKEIVEVFETLEYNSDTEIASVIWSYSCENKQIYQDFPFQMKMYYPDTMHKIIEQSGLSIINVWGSYEKDTFNESSSLQIYKCIIK